MQDENKQKNDDLGYFWGTQDPKVNNETSPPLDEKIRTPAVWVIEAYPPSFINNFRNGVEKLGWTSDSRIINSDFPDTIDRMRSQAFGGGWLNLGYVFGPGKNTFIPQREAALPINVSSIRVSVLQQLPSTTFLICQFMFEEENIVALEEPLRATYKTYTKPIKKGHSFITVEHQKQAATHAMREYLRTLCINWVSENLPGYFSSENTELKPLTCEFITLEKHKPFEPIKKKEIYSFLRLLGIDNGYHAWVSESLNGLYLQLNGENADEPGRALISGNINEILSDDKLEMYGRESREEKIIAWSQYLDHTLGSWGLHELARDFERQIGKTRDMYGAVELTDAVNAAKNLSLIDKNYLMLHRDMVPFANELLSYCDNPYFMHEVYEFNGLHESRKEHKLFENIREYGKSCSKYIISGEEQIRSIADRTGQIVSTITTEKLSRTNIKLQRGVYLMTFALLVLTIVLVWIELKDDIDLNKSIEVIKSIFKLLTTGKIKA